MKRDGVYKKKNIYREKNLNKEYSEFLEKEVYKKAVVRGVPI